MVIGMGLKIRSKYQEFPFLLQDPKLLTNGKQFWWDCINLDAMIKRNHNKLRPLLIFCFCLAAETICAQTNVKKDSSYLISLNQQIDQLVVIRNVTALDSAYASDFVFSHGSGKIEGKDSWLKTVGRATYLSRVHDSVTVEMHPALAILRGKMAIQRVDKDSTAKYHLRYIRVYRHNRSRWEMISHITTEEIHEL